MEGTKSENIVYAIVRKDSPSNYLYVGSTSQKLSCRESKHRSDAKTGSTSKLHTHMRKNDVYNFKCVCLEKLFGNREDREKKEQEYMDKYSNKHKLLNEHKAYTGRAKRVDKRMTHCQTCNKHIRTKHYKRHLKSQLHKMNAIAGDMQAAMRKFLI